MEEFACNHCGMVQMNEDFLQKLDNARAIAGVPFRITSGYRCPAHNAAVGGKPTSSHMSGYAVDIACDDSDSRWHIIGSLYEAGLTRVGIAKTFIHVDADPGKPSELVWLY